VWEANVPELESFGVSVFLNLRIDKHLEGEKTAETPKMQIALKIEPTRGFRQGMLPDTVGGKAVRAAMRSKPMNDRSVKKVMSKLRCCLGVMSVRCSE
jgi:hypothetical protein